jgi:hypothetical protein
VLRTLDFRPDGAEHLAKITFEGSGRIFFHSAPACSSSAFMPIWRRRDAATISFVPIRPGTFHLRVPNTTGEGQATFNVK